MSKSVLEQLSEDIMVMVAIHADYESVGVDNDASYLRWFDRLHEAIDAGLEEAERRAGGFDES